MPESRKPGLRNWRAQALLVLGLALLLGLLFQGTRGVWGPEEGRFTNVAVQMLDSGDWLLPRRHPEQELPSPPMTYWLLAASMELFGRNEWALRVPSALAFALTALLSLLIGRRLVPRRPWLPPVLFVSSFVPFAAANLINPDFVLTFWLTLAVYAYVELWHKAHRPEASYWRLLFWVGLGGGFLTKGWIALLPLLAILVYRRLGAAPVPRLWTLGGVLAFLAVAAPWYVLMMLRDPDLVRLYFGSELFGRIFTEIHDKNPEWYGWLVVYGPVLLVGTLPWGLLIWRRLPELLGDLARFRYPLYRKLHREVLFLLCWLLVPLLILFLARSRMPLQLLPLFVPWALLLARLMERSRPARFVLYAFPVWIGLLLLLKGYAAGFDYHKDTRDMARQIRQKLDDPPSAVVFVQEPALYGLGFYLGTKVERVGFVEDASRAIDRGLAESLAEPDAAARLWVTTADRVERFADQSREFGYAPRVVGKAGQYHFLKLDPLPKTMSP